MGMKKFYEKRQGMGREVAKKVLRESEGKGIMYDEWKRKGVVGVE